MANEFKARIGVVTPFLQSTVATGTAPFTVASTTPVTNLNIGGNAAGLSTTLVATSGGTGQSSFAVGDLLYASTTTALSKLSAGTNGYVLTSNGAGTAPTWQVVASGAAAAGTLTGSTLAAGVTASSLTSFGSSPTLSLPTIDNIKIGYATTATAAGTTTLTASSNYRQFFTGTTTQTIVLPVTSTLVTGISWEIENNSTGTLTVNSSGGSLVGTIPSGVCAHVICIGTTLTTAADWDWDYISYSTITGTGSNVLAVSPAFTGTPTAPTAAQGTNTTQVATTAFAIQAANDAAVALAIALG
jgi:hypothetical protein